MIFKNQHSHFFRRSNFIYFLSYLHYHLAVFLESIFLKDNPPILFSYKPVEQILDVRIPHRSLGDLASRNATINEDFFGWQGRMWVSVVFTLAFIRSPSLCRPETIVQGYPTPRWGWGRIGVFSLSVSLTLSLSQSDRLILGPQAPPPGGGEGVGQKKFTNITDTEKSPVRFFVFISLLVLPGGGKLDGPNLVGKKIPRKRTKYSPHFQGFPPNFDLFSPHRSLTLGTFPHGKRTKKIPHF